MSTTINFVTTFTRALRTFWHRSAASRRIVALSLAAGLAAAGPIGAAAAGNHHERFAPGRILVKPRDVASDAQFTEVVRRHGARALRRIHATRVNVVEVAPGSEEYMAQALALDPEVEYAEVDRVVYPEATANDTYYTSAWHLTKIGAPTAWDTARGAGVVVAVLDSGVDSTHPDLAGKLVPGYNLYDNNSDTSDVYGHGTKVAGVVGAVSNNGAGVTSIAWDTKIMPVRVSLPDGSAYISTIANGITYAADHGAQIANASFASLAGSSTIKSSADYMRSKGGLVVVAAGNYGTLDSTPNTTSVISVSATTSSDALASWSSYGPYVDVAAPGDGIWTTTKGGGYASVSGTSFSSPATAAVLALMKSANTALTNTQLESLLFSTARDLGTAGYDQYFGYGRIDAAAAVAAAKAYVTSVDTTKPTVSIASPTGGTVSSTVTVSVNASDNVGVTKVELYNGSTLIGTDTASPYSFSWDTTKVANGTYSLVAYAYDAAGNKGTSTTVTVTVSNASADTTAPTVSFLSPAADATVSGKVSIKLSASDNVGVKSLNLYIDGALKSTTNLSSLSYSWNTGSVSSGTHTLTATAKDAAGNSATKAISVTLATTSSTSTHGSGKK